MGSLRASGSTPADAHAALLQRQRLEVWRVLQTRGQLDHVLVSLLLCTQRGEITTRQDQPFTDLRSAQLGCTRPRWVWVGTQMKPLR